jgi:hypothetical protein
VESRARPRRGAATPSIASTRLLRCACTRPQARRGRRAGWSRPGRLPSDLRFEASSPATSVDDGDGPG